MTSREVGFRRKRWEHGTVSGYTLGCRCQRCTTAQRLKARQYRAQVRERERANPTKGIAVKFVNAAVLPVPTRWRCLDCGVINQPEHHCGHAPPWQAIDAKLRRECRTLRLEAA